MNDKKTIGALTVLKLLGAMLSIVYSIIQVHYFGTSQDIEIYFAATTLLLIMFSLSQSGVLSEIFLPIYHKLKVDKGNNTARKAFSVIVNRISIFILVFCVLSFFIAPLLMDLVVPGFETVAKARAVLMFRATFFLLLPMVINSFFIMILNAEQIYGRTELIGFFRVLLNLIILVSLFRYIGVWALAVSLIGGHLFSSIIYIYLMKKNNFKLYPILALKDFDHNSFFKAIYSTFLYVGSTQIYNIVLNSSISLLPQGYYAVFNYITSLYSKTRGIFTQPLTTVFFTSFSIALAKKAKNLQKTIKAYLGFTLFLLGLVLLFIISFGDLILTIIWGSEKFPPDLIFIAYQILVFNYIALLITSFGNVYRKITIALEQAKLAYIGWAIAQLLTAGIIFLLFKQIQQDALKYVFLINVTLLNGVSWLIVAKKNWSFANTLDWRKTFQLALVFFLILPIGIYFGNLIWDLNWFSNKRITLFVATLIFSFALLLIYSVVGYLLKVKELHWVYNKLILLKTRILTQKG